MSVVDSLRALYRGSPTWLQQAMFALEGARVGRFRYGGSYQAIYNAASLHLQWTPEQLIAFRDQRLGQHLAHVLRSVPRYQWRVDALESTRNHEAGAEDLLSILPLTSKEAIRNGLHGYLSTNNTRKTLRVSTGGTTGDPLRFLSSRKAIQEQWAIWWRYRALHGVGRQTKAGHFGGQPVVPADVSRPPFWRVNPLGNLVYFSPNHLHRSTARAYVQEINRQQISWLHGYPSVLKSLALYIQDLGLDVHDSISLVTTGAESLSPSDRSLLRQTFEAPVRQHYGLAEASANLSECRQGMLHVDEDHAFVEFIPGALDGLFRIVGTTLSNTVTAFVRYETGDVARLPNQPCQCTDHPGRSVAQVEGRLADFLQLSNGALVGPVNQIAKWTDGIRHLQLVHHGNDSITALVVPRAGFTEENRAALLKRIADRTSVPLDIEVQLIKSPLVSPHGKVLSIIKDP